MRQNKRQALLLEVTEINSAVNWWLNLTYIELGQIEFLLRVGIIEIRPYIQVISLVICQRPVDFVGNLGSRLERAKKLLGFGTLFMSAEIGNLKIQRCELM
jgi:hypothetical protein